MRFTITAHCTDIPLDLDILGYHIEIANLDTGSISVSDADGHISIGYVEAQTFIADDTLQPDIIKTATSHTVDTVVDPVVDTEQPITTDTVESTDQAEQLFLILSALRKQIALEAKLPTYIIFHDNTLRDMCKLLPSSIEELSSIHGVGKTKLEKYGLIFIRAIQDYIAHLKEVA